MIGSRLFSIEELDKLIYTKLDSEIQNLKGYVLEGDNYNRINFKRLLVFYNNELFEKSNININKIDRWINAYYWYSIYITELKKQNISIESHIQPRSKLIEQIDYYADSDFNWRIIEKIENELEIK